MFLSKKKNISKDFIKIAALLIHTAKIDEEYSSQEEEIIKRALIKIGVKNEEVDGVIKDAKEMEENSNQILNFTREVKNMDNQSKIDIIETLWRIIYSNNSADIYEMSLMRRLGGLLYIDSKIMGDIKEKIKNEFLK